MLERALIRLPDASRDRPIVIIGRNMRHVKTLMQMFGKLAWESGYNVRAIRADSFLIDESARVDFKIPTQMERIMGIRDRIVEIFIDHYADECLPVTEQVAQRL